MALSLVGLDLASAFYVRQAGKQPADVLVLGSADGRVAFALAGRGHGVVAVEPSARMHTTAEEKQAADSPDGKVKLVHSDLRTLRLERKFPLIVAPQNAFGLMLTLDDFEAALITVAQHLAADGVFAFDLRSDVQPDPTPLGRTAFAAHMRERGGQSVRRMRRRVFTPNEVDAALNRVLLEARERYGDFLSRPWEDTDEMQVVVAGRVNGQEE
jgi:SAM-dependent methyltransferase